MKFCFVAFFSYPLFNPNCKITFGGAEVQLFNLSQKLSLKHEVTFIVGNFGQKKDEMHDRIRVLSSVKLGEKHGFIEKFRSAFLQMITMKKSRADIFIKRAAGPEVGIIAIYCLILQKKFIYMTAHEIDCSGEYKKSNPLLGWLYEFGLKRADIVITQNYAHRKMLKANYAIEAEVLSSGYDIPPMRVQPGKYILWVARLDEWKQPEVYIKLASFFPNENFVMIAPTSRNVEYAKMIEEEAKKVKNIKYIPGVNFSEVDRYFQSAKIFINTSHYEGFPNTFVQAAMHAVPIISLNVDPDGFIEKNNVGTCAKNDFSKMKNYFETLLNDRKMYDTVSLNSYTYAKNNHNIEDVCSKFLDIFRK